MTSARPSARRGRTRLTGQILDADIVLTDGWIRAFWYQSNEYLPAESRWKASRPETLRWLEDRPELGSARASRARRPRIVTAFMAERSRRARKLLEQHREYDGGHRRQHRCIANEELTELASRRSVRLRCSASRPPRRPRAWR